MATTDDPLDLALTEWCREIRETLKDVLAEQAGQDRSGPDPEIDLALNGRALHIGLRNCAEHGIDLEGTAHAIKGGDCFDRLVKALRDEMPEIGWPVRIKLRFEGFSRSSWWRVDACALGVCGKLFGELGERSNDMVTRCGGYSSYNAVKGLDRLVEGMRLVQMATPASNRPVCAWSTGMDMAGMRHVALEEIHARSEAELILKQSLFRRGLDEFRAMIESGRIEPQRNDECTWFTATELDDLDLHPLGKVRDFTSALDQANAVLAARKGAEIEP